jgi:hypothetical protein
MTHSSSYFLVSSGFLRSVQIFKIVVRQLLPGALLSVNNSWSPSYRSIFVAAHQISCHWNHIPISSRSTWSWSWPNLQSCTCRGSGVLVFWYRIGIVLYNTTTCKLLMILMIWNRISWRLRRDKSNVSFACTAWGCRSMIWWNKSREDTLVHTWKHHATINSIRYVWQIGWKLN